MQIQISELTEIYDDIKKRIKNKNKLYNFEKYKMQNLINIKNMLESNLYHIKKYNIFLVKEPKIRVVMSSEISDKIVNHYMAKIMYNKLSKYLLEENIASRKNKGTSYGIEKFKKYLEYYKQNDEIYCLKMDLKKYFHNIDHKVLKSLIITYLNKEEYDIMCTIIDSIDSKYINEEIKKLNVDLLYKEGKGLCLGNMSSQILAIFYLHKIHYYLKHNLKIKHLIIYMDDYVILHNDKRFLKQVLNEFKEKLIDYKIELNLKKLEYVN